MSRLRPASLLLVALAGCAPRGTAGPATPTGSPRTASLLPQLRAEAAALAPFVTSAEARRFLDATAALPAIPPRGALYQQKGTRNVITPAEHAALPAAQGATYTRLDLDETLYYSAKYGTPLAYARPLDLVAGADGDALRGRRIIDFGYGLIGHLRLLASLGNEVTGIDVDPLLPSCCSLTAVRLS